jgi:aldehyde dehydrogenase (NAD+)
LHDAVPGTSREQRMAWLQPLHDAVAAAERDIVEVMVAEYGGTVAMAQGTAGRAAASFAIAPLAAPRKSSRANRVRPRPR